ncbi:MAG: AAA family ATPase [Brevibacterium yomogidense]
MDAALDWLDEDQILFGVGPAVRGLAELLRSAPDDDRAGRDGYLNDRHGDGSGRVDFQLGPVHRSAFPVGPDEVRFVATNGLRLIRVDRVPVVVFARDFRGDSHGDSRGDTGVRVEVLAADLPAARSALEKIDAAVWAVSSLRGRVVSFRTATSGLYTVQSPSTLQSPSTQHSPSALPRPPALPHPVIDFVERPGLTADDVVLPAGRLTRVESIVLGMTQNAAGLRAAGQHLSRSVLLHGPAGSGKTHTVRYLLSQSPETTAFILPGTFLSSLRAGDSPTDATYVDATHADSMHGAARREDGAAGFIRQVLATARQLTPAIVVLEDVDLIDAGHAADDADRSGLAHVLDALDELRDDEDADIAVILTTRDAAAIQQALARRPRVIDLALEVPQPDVGERERLLARSARALPVTAAGLRTAAEAAVATPGSFPRHAVRSAVLGALSQGAEVDDARLLSAVRALMAERYELRTASPEATGDDRGPTATEPHESSEPSEWPWPDGTVAEVRGAGDVLAVLRAREGQRDSFGADGAFRSGHHEANPGGDGGLGGDHGLGGGVGSADHGLGGGAGFDDGGLGGGRGFDDDDPGEGDGLDGGDGLDHGGRDVEVIDDLDDGLSGEDLLDLDLDDED